MTLTGSISGLNEKLKTNLSISSKIPLWCRALAPGKWILLFRLWLRKIGRIDREKKAHVDPALALGKLHMLLWP
jgi:hypothetical protein